MSNMVNVHAEYWKTINDLDRDKTELRERIKQLEKELMEVKSKHSVLVAGVVLYEDRADRIKRLEDAVEAYRTAYTPDGHVAPHDCFATGPKTGNLYQDLFACPGCWAELKAKEAKLSVNPIQSLGANLMKAGIGFTTEDKP